MFEGASLRILDGILTALSKDPDGYTQSFQSNTGEIRQATGSNLPLIFNISLPFKHIRTLLLVNMCIYA
jgi:hypothetical protein